MAKISLDIVAIVIFVSMAAVHVQGGRGKKKYSTRSSETRAQEELNMDELKGLSLTDWIGMAAQNIEFYANRLGVMDHDDPSIRAAMIYTLFFIPIYVKASNHLHLILPLATRRPMSRLLLRRRRFLRKRKLRSRVTLIKGYLLALGLR